MFEKTDHCQLTWNIFVLSSASEVVQNSTDVLNIALKTVLVIGVIAEHLKSCPLSSTSTREVIERQVPQIAGFLQPSGKESRRLQWEQPQDEEEDLWRPHCC